MRETRADTALAITLALLLHGLLALLLFIGLWWTRDAASAAAGEPITADLIDPNALSRSMRRALAAKPEPLPPPVEQPQPIEQETAPPPQPLPEPSPQDSPMTPQRQVQEAIPEPDLEQQEEVRADAVSAEARAREQEEKRRQEQIDLTERERQEEAEQRRRLSEMELERQKQLADIRKQRALAARDARLAEEKLKQLADRRAQQASADAMASVSPPPGNGGIDEGLLARYKAALISAIERQWTRPDSVPLGQRCRVQIRQLPGGEVIDAQVIPPCPYDELGQRSLEAAVLKAQPLPYAGFESVFSRDLTIIFTPQER